MAIGFCHFLRLVCDFSFRVCCILFGTCVRGDSSIFQPHLWHLYVPRPTLRHCGSRPFFGYVHFLKCRQFLCLSLCWAGCFMAATTAVGSNRRSPVGTQLPGQRVLPLRMIAQVSGVSGAAGESGVSEGKRVPGCGGWLTCPGILRLVFQETFRLSASFSLAFLWPARTLRTPSRLLAGAFVIVAPDSWSIVNALSMSVPIPSSHNSNLRPPRASFYCGNIGVVSWLSLGGV